MSCFMFLQKENVDKNSRLFAHFFPSHTRVKRITGLFCLCVCLPCLEEDEEEEEVVATGGRDSHQSSLFSHQNNNKQMVYPLFSVDDR